MHLRPERSSVLFWAFLFCNCWRHQHRARARAPPVLLPSTSLPSTANKFLIEPDFSRAQSGSSVNKGEWESNEGRTRTRNHALAFLCHVSCQRCPSSRLILAKGELMLTGTSTLYSPCMLTRQQIPESSV